MISGSRDAPGLLRRDDVEQVGLEFLDLQLGDVRCASNSISSLFGRYSMMFGYRSLQALRNRPFFDTRSGLASRMIELAARLGLLEVLRDHAGALVGPGRAAVRCLRDADGEDAAVGQCLQLAVQRHRLRPGLPGVQHPADSARCKARHLVDVEVDAGRRPAGRSSAIPRQRAPASCRSRAPVTSSRTTLHAIAAQPVVADRHVLDGLRCRPGPGCDSGRI